MKQITFLLLMTLALGTSQRSQAQVSVLTYHNDNLRTGANTNETILTPANISTNAFRRLFARGVDGYVYAQPLVAAGVNTSRFGPRNVVFVATEHDSVYAFDADTGRSYWHKKLLPRRGHTVASIKDAQCDDLIPEIGITSTPVIDAASSTLYVLEKGKTNNTVFFQRLHALDLATGAEKFGGPVSLSALVSGTGDGSATVHYDPLLQHQRSALLLVNGAVYIASASHCDVGTYHGWILGYNATNLSQVAAFNTTPDGGLGGVWMAGSGPAADAGGNIYCSTGNGTFDADTGGNDYGDSILRLNPSSGLDVDDFFAPFNQAALNAGDLDLGSGGVLLLPDQSGGHPHVAITAGKQGTIYVLDRDDLGGFHNGSDNQILQSVPGGVGPAFCTPAYFNGIVYFGGAIDTLRSFTVTNGLLATNPVSRSAAFYQFPGATPSVSANGTNNAIVWTIQTEAYTTKGAAVLRAFDASDLSRELYNSTTRRQPPGGAVKFAVPTIANGRVYVGAVHRLAVYGLRQ